MTDSRNNLVTLLAGGDIGPVIEPTDQFSELVLPVLREADLRFGQCEKVYSERGSLPGSHPGHNTPRMLHPRMASIWKTAGIDIVSLAGNHTMDCGPEALLETIKLFRSMGKQVIGAGKDEEEARKPAIVDCKGIKIAFLGYCSVLSEGHEAGLGKPGCAPMRAHTYYERGKDQHEDFQPGEPPKILTVPYEQDLQALQEDIRKVKREVDVVVMSIHWGLHHIPKTIAKYQPLVAHAAIDAGADLILGHHAHVLKAIEVYKGKVCFYSLGNFMITGSGRLVQSSVWDFCWYRLDPECVPPKGKYGFPADNRKTLIAKAVFSKQGVERVSFLPAFINGQAQPAVMPPTDPKFQEILEFMEWSSDQYPHKFRVDGNEVIVEDLC